MSRCYDKITALVTAYRARYKSSPSTNAAMLIVAVAELESEAGDAWNDAHDWGCIVRRPMTAAEEMMVEAGRVPQPTDKNEILEGDSDPVKGKYQTWFWKFDTDVEGADKLLQVLLDERPVIKASIDTLNAEGLAKAMYASHYYSGFHNPLLPGGIEADEDDYADAIARGLAKYAAALPNWTPNANEDQYSSPITLPNGEIVDLDETIGQQKATIALGYGPPVSHGGADGIDGPATRTALMAFQANANITVTGVMNPPTVAAFQAAFAPPKS
jgi:hypothetical protein